MTRIHAFALVSSLFVAAAGCDAPANDAAAPTLYSAKTTTSGPSSILPAGAEPIYFGTTSYVVLGSAGGNAYGYFNSSGGATLTVGATNDDGSGSDTHIANVDFKLQHAVQNARTKAWSWEVVGQTSKRAPTVSYKPAAAELLLVTSAAEAAGSTVAMTLSESCGGIAGSKCESGLFCEFDVTQACGAADQSGSCVAAPDFCSELAMPVCGCDGNTYANSCFAHRNSVSVSYAGDCASGEWSVRVPNGGAIDGGLVYNFASDGSFTATDFPGCHYAQVPCALQPAPSTGRYVAGSTTVTLTYAQGTHTPATVVLTRASTDGVDHLTGSDFGFAIDLTRDGQ